MKRLLALLGAAGITLLALGGVPAATASTRHAPPPVGALKIVLKANTSEGATSEGVNSVMLDSTAFSTFTQLTVSNGKFIYENQNQNCVHGTDTNTVTISTACGSGNTASQWNVVSNGGVNVLKNVAYGKYVYSDSGNCLASAIDVVLAALGTPGLCIYKITGT